MTTMAVALDRNLFLAYYSSINNGQLKPAIWKQVSSLQEVSRDQLTQFNGRPIRHFADILRPTMTFPLEFQLNFN